MRDFLKMDTEVDEMILQKKTEFSFEVEDEMIHYPELDKIGELIQ